MSTREMKDSGLPWANTIPSTWSVKRGKRVLNLMQREVRPEDEVVTCFRDGEVILRRLRRTEGFTISDKEIGYQGINVGDIVIHGMDGFAGAMGISKSKGKGTPVYVVCTSKEENYSPYIIYYLKCLAANNVFLALSTGIRERSCDLKWNKISALPFICPSKTEQQRIATFLDEKCKDIDTLITLQEEMIAELQAYKQSVISETATKGLNPNVTMKDSGVEWIGEIPQEWVLRKMKNLCLFINGDRSNNYPSPEDFTDSGIPFCGADSLNKIYVDLKNVRYITIKKYDQMGGLKIRYGDILYTLRGSTIGKNAISLFDNGTVASSLMGIRANDQVMNNKFLVFWLHSKFERFQREICINGSTAPNLSAANVGEFIISLPPLSEQQAIADYLDTKCAQIDELITLKQQKITELQDYKKSLIYEYVTGKKEVPANN